MDRDLHARYGGDAPFYEVWYGKVNFGPDRAFWFRYTLLDGRVREAATWAILFADGRVRGDRDVESLDDLVLPARGETVFRLNDGQLTEIGARGHCGELGWDLEWTSRREGFLYAPRWMERLGLLGGNYDSCLPGLRLTGEVRAGTEQYELDGAPGMVGHIYGTAMSGRAWGWIHCNDFEDGDAMFEALAIELGGIADRISPVAWYVLDLEGERHVFRPPATLFGTQNQLGVDGWSFTVQSGGRHLEGEVPSPQNTALIEYTDTDGSHRWCSNSKLAPLELTFREGDGPVRRLRSRGSSAFEWVTVDRPDRAPLVD